MNTRWPKLICLIGSLLSSLAVPSLAGASDPKRPAEPRHRAHRITRAVPGSNVAVTVQIAPAVMTPKRVALEQNGPNPFSMTTVIPFSLPLVQHVSLKVYSSSGREVVTLVERTEEAGFHSVRWDGRDAKGHGVSSGVYFCCLATKGCVTTRKMLLIR